MEPMELDTLDPLIEYRPFADVFGADIVVGDLISCADMPIGEGKMYGCFIAVGTETAKMLSDPDTRYQMAADITVLRNAQLLN